MNELRLAEDAIQTLRVFLKKPETEKKLKESFDFLLKKFAFREGCRAGFPEPRVDCSMAHFWTLFGAEKVGSLLAFSRHYLKIQ
jgi:hypothetical protein